MIQENERAIKSYLESKKGTSPATQYHYKARLDILLAYLDKNKISVNKFNQDHLTKFLGNQYSKFKPKTMNHIKAVVISFLKYQFPNDWFSRFPNLINICKSQKVIPKYDASQMLSTEEVQTIIQKENDPFWKLVFAMQFYGGCRPSEVCNLKWKDVTFADDGIYFKIYSAKNNRNFEKFVPLEFSFYLKEIQKTTTSEYCFTKQDNQPIKRGTLYKRLIRLSLKVFPNKHINPYLLRHSIATILYGKAEKGELNDDIVARQLGHTKSMKEAYCHLDINTLRNNAKKIYIKPELTAKQKNEYDKKIEEQDKIIAALSSGFEDYKKEVNNYLTIMREQQLKAYDEMPDSEKKSIPDNIKASITQAKEKYLSNRR